MKKYLFLSMVFAVGFLFIISASAEVRRANLRITDVTFSPEEITAGETMTVNITIKNTTTGSCPVNIVGIKVKGAMESLARVDLRTENLAHNQTRVCTLTFPFPNAGNSPITLVSFASSHGFEYGDEKESVFLTKCKYVLRKKLTIKPPKVPGH